MTAFTLPPLRGKVIGASLDRYEAAPDYGRVLHDSD